MRSLKRIWRWAWPLVGGALLFQLGDILYRPHALEEFIAWLRDLMK